MVGNGIRVKRGVRVNYYEILEINSNASLEVIHASYKALSKQYHPDNYGDDGTMMKKLNEAFDILSDSAKRKQYDAQIGLEEQSKDIEDSVDKGIPGDTLGEKILTVVIGMGYFLFQGILFIIQIAWGIIVLLLIIGFFTGHSQALFGKIFDWIISFIG